MKVVLFISCFFFLIAPSITTVGQDAATPYLQEKQTPISLEKADWEKVTTGLDYGEVEKVVKKPKKETELNVALIANILKILSIIFIIILVVFLLRYFVGIKGIPKAKSKRFDPNEKIDTQTIAEHIHEYDLTALIQQAIDRQAYTIATRLYYLLVIKTLAEKELIQWKKDKTNRNYLNELVGIQLKNQFKTLTNIFERIWYGEVNINAQIFKGIQGQFQEFINSLATQKV